jgi:HEAT repeat protein
VSKVAVALQSASSFRVRQQAAETLRKSGSTEALEALLEARSQRDPRVRTAIASALSGFLQPDSFAGLRDWILSEKNPGVTAAALRSLAVHLTPGARELLIQFLNTSCFKERMAEAALDSMRRQEDPSLVGPILAALQTRSSRWPTALTASALEAIGHLNREQREHPLVRETLLSYLQNPQQRLRIAAIQGLGNLRDPRAIPALESFASLSPYRAEKEPAQKALETIQSARGESEELKSLRTELQQLRSLTGEFKKELEDIQKKLKPEQTR